MKIIKSSKHITSTLCQISTVGITIVEPQMQVDILRRSLVSRTTGTAAYLLAKFDSHVS